MTRPSGSFTRRHQAAGHPGRGRHSFARPFAHATGDRRRIETGEAMDAAWRALPFSPPRTCPRRNGAASAFCCKSRTLRSPTRVTQQPLGDAKKSASPAKRLPSSSPRRGTPAGGRAPNGRGRRLGAPWPRWPSCESGAGAPTRRRRTCSISTTTSRPGFSFGLQRCRQRRFKGRRSHIFAERLPPGSSRHRASDGMPRRSLHTSTRHRRQPSRSGPSTQTPHNTQRARGRYVRYGRRTKIRIIAPRCRRRLRSEEPGLPGGDRHSRGSAGLLGRPVQAGSRTAASTSCDGDAGARPDLEDLTIARGRGGQGPGPEGHGCIHDAGALSRHGARSCPTSPRRPCRAPT